MKLTPNELKPFLHGAVADRSTDAELIPLRCTERQIAAFGALANILGERAAATTGVAIEMLTDSEKFTATAASGGRFEIHVDGLMHSTYLLPDAPDGARRMEIALPGGEHCVKLLFPSHSAGKLASVELADGATYRPVTHARRWLFIGDSITQGWNAGDDSLSYALRTAHFFDADAVIQGVGGSYFHETTFDTVDFDPDVVSVALGTNDAGHYRSLDDLRQHARAHLDAICSTYRGKLLIGISPIWRADAAKCRLPFESVCALVKEEILAHGMLLVEGEALVPHDTRFFTDGLHPDANGFSLYAEALCRRLLPIIK